MKAHLQVKLRFEDDIHVFSSAMIKVDSYFDMELALKEAKEQIESLLARQRIEDLLGE